MLWLLFGEFFFEFAGELVDVGGFAKTMDPLGCGFHVDAGVLAELLEHLEPHGDDAQLCLPCRTPVQRVGLQVVYGVCGCSKRPKRDQDRYSH